MTIPDIIARLQAIEQIPPHVFDPTLPLPAAFRGGRWVEQIRLLRLALTAD